MICDVLIIKDGLPLLSTNFSNSPNTKNLFSEVDDLIMVSGFFSALNSFSDSFEDLGTISELKLSNNNLKLSFLKDSNIPDLIYLATYDKNSELVNVQRFLKKLSNNFLKKFNIDQISNWNGRLDSFKSFEEIIKLYIEEEDNKEKAQFNTQVFDWIKGFENPIDHTATPKKESEIVEPVPDYYSYIPTIMTSEKVNPKYYITGDTLCKIYEVIDGEKNINEVAEFLNLSPIKVYTLCKSLCKIQLISFN
ncbi:MAG: hypothetical protein ACFFB0_12085 [Promethearchaeota archaeon]